MPSRVRYRFAAAMAVLGLAGSACAPKPSGATRAPNRDRDATSSEPAAGADRDFAAEEEPAAPRNAPPAEASPESGGLDELAQLEAELGQNEAVLLEAGVELDATVARPAKEDAQGEALQYSEGAGVRCDRICRIADAVCDLELRICELEERHSGEPRYQRACTRAQSDCERAVRACDRCDRG
jgi:hypothetical protein